MHSLGFDLFFGFFFVNLTNPGVCLKTQKVWIPMLNRTQAKTLQMRQKTRMPKTKMAKTRANKKANRRAKTERDSRISRLWFGTKR
jgi:hypothetical protein